ncbi:MAG TPA: membrane protein insertase YidC [Chitinophagaceae bacterium]|jgi:YidC/Oxa1 family membrane protein insertase|nr:membrane protein insertase YidC [Chitinophagaceae bacterium]
MNFDRNTIIGFVLLGLLFIGYFFYIGNEQRNAQVAQAKKDSAERARRPKVDSAALRLDSLRADSVQKASAAGQFGTALQAPETVITVNTDLLQVAFTNKGGQPKWVELKGFKDPEGKPVRLSATEFDKFSYAINTGAGRTADITNFNFSGGQVTQNPDGSQVVTYQLQGTGTSITHQYILRKGQYLVDFNIGLTGAPSLTSGGTLGLTWQNRARRLQKDIAYEREMSTVNFVEDGDFDYESAMSSDTKTFDEPVSWIGIKQQFFNSTLIAKNKFTGGTLQWTAPANEADPRVVDAVANMKLAVPAGANATIPMGLYYGPTDYQILKQYGNDMEDMVNLGSGMFAFVKWINRWIVIPVFNLFSTFTSNYGIVILLLTLFIRLLISPLTYTSYLSGAKMKVLRPEIEKLKAKHGNDQQAMQMDQMKLFREAGVNPLGGCIPALLQIPIFFALYSFFNSSVALRGEPFLWADDLSQYDSIANLPFSIPFYGDHVSLFTITAVLTSFLISLYSMSMTPDQSNPVLKYMPYVFPFILLFVFNRLPAGLTWYYTVSNIITLALQFVIQNYIINHDKILAKMEENRKKPKAKSKFQARLEEMQEQQKKMRDMQERNKR